MTDEPPFPGMIVPYPEIIGKGANIPGGNCVSHGVRRDDDPKSSEGIMGHLSGEYRSDSDAHRWADRPDT
jgi:hypothetical protein